MEAYMTNDEVWLALQEYGDVGYHDMPLWLRQELEARRMYFIAREPTEQEIIETEIDALEHRITNNELTIDDYLNHYTGKRRLSYV